MSRSYIGIDAGGTTTRVLIAGADGSVVGKGGGPGANLWSSGTSVPQVILEALRDSLGDLDRSAVASGVIAIAGGVETSPEGVRRITDAWTTLGLPGVPSIITDALAAYAAGTARPDGVVLAAGTGSVAALIEAWGIRRRVGGHGWMLGDEGSAVWLGLEGVRAVLHALDDTGPSTVLVDTISKQLGAVGLDGVNVEQRIVDIVNGMSPARLGHLAPAVVEACEEGDAIALALVESGVEHLVSMALAVAREEPPPIVVVAGTLPTKISPIASRVRSAILEAWPSVPIAEATSGEAGAVALAVLKHTGAPISDPALARLQRASAELTSRARS